jgi:HSP20 family protein
MDHWAEHLLGGGGGERACVFAPRTNVAETDKEYEITLDLPGVKAEDVEVELKDDQLWITGERKQEVEENDKTFHRVERHYGRFQRVIGLNDDADTDAVDAKYEDGVLRISVAKSEAALPKRIEVKS